MIWTLLGELARHPDAHNLLAKLLNQISLRSSQPAFEKPNVSTLMIEQSFSDFGDADALLLLDYEAGQRCAFIEAKVSCGKSTWHIGNELSKFRAGNDSQKKAFSNLFCQLYAKQLLVETLKQGAVPDEGVAFLEGFKKRKIGKNKVVHRAVEKLKEYVQHATYIALLSNTEGFHDAVCEFETWSGNTCGMWAVLSWAQVEDFCHQHELALTLEAFKYNHSQIY